MTGLAVILFLAAVGGILARVFKQPVILGYVLAGMLFAMGGGMRDVNMRQMVTTMGQLGITLLLFLVGLEMSVAELKKMGKVAVVVGVLQIAITAILGMGLCLGLGFGVTAGLYLGVALSFSSTIMVVKILTEKRDLQSLYGKIAVGILLVQDFVAIGMLVLLSGAGQASWNWVQLILVIVKAIVMLSLTLWLSNKVLPLIFGWLSKSTEILFIAAVAWCLAIAVIAASPWVGFTMEIGGFLAGLALANAAAHFEIVARVRPLRDFFVTLFFVSLGASTSLMLNRGSVFSALVLSLFVILVGPLIVMVVMGMMGYKKRTGFMVGITMGQISEFSLVLMSLAYKLGQVDATIVGITTLVGIITMVGSSYVMTNAEKIYRKISRFLSGLETAQSRKLVPDAEKMEHHVVLFGHNRAGSVLLPAINALGKPVVVVDFNPEVVEELDKLGVKAIYGDVADNELYDQLGIADADLVVSTVPDASDNLQLLSSVRRMKTKPVLVLTAVDQVDAERLYKAGADYVLVPHSVGGEFLAAILSRQDLKLFSKYGQIHRDKIGKLW
jgi:Kef-type K+ transport system membrane component KefB